MKLEEKTRFAAPKQGNELKENEDQVRVRCPAQIGSARRERARVALSDGASESAFASNWASILVRRFVDSPPEIASLNHAVLNQWLEPCQTRWRSRLPEKLPWHGRNKVQRGALATLVGLTFRCSGGNKPVVSWQAMAVGDSCLFVVREDSLALAWPAIGSAQFDNAPPLICSNPDNNQQLWPQVRFAAGEGAPGDQFILASDALSAWILRERESGRKPWHSLLAIGNKQEWREWVADRRSERAIRNDDTTLLVTELVE